MPNPSTPPACILEDKLQEVKNYLILQRDALLEDVMKENHQLTEAQLNELKAEIMNELGAAIKSVEDLESIQNSIEGYWAKLIFGW